MNNKMMLFGILALTVIAGGVVLAKNAKKDTLMNGSPSATPEVIMAVSPSPVVSPGSSEPADTTTMENVKEFKVSGSNFKFDLAEMKVKKGDTVRVTFTNSAGMHDWRLDEFNAATKQLQAGQSETVEFVADQVGTFEYYCSVGQHRQNGMVGSLIVE